MIRAKFSIEILNCLGAEAYNDAHEQHASKKLDEMVEYQYWRSTATHVMDQVPHVNWWIRFNDRRRLRVIDVTYCGYHDGHDTYEIELLRLDCYMFRPGHARPFILEKDLETLKNEFRSNYFQWSEFTLVEKSDE